MVLEKQLLFDFMKEEKRAEARKHRNEWLGIFGLATLTSVGLYYFAMNGPEIMDGAQKYISNLF